MVRKLDKQTIVSEFHSHWATTLVNNYTGRGLGTSRGLMVFMLDSHTMICKFDFH